MCRPAPVHALEDTLVDQRSDELLDEERVALGPFDDDVAKARRQLGGEKMLEHVRGVGRSERLEPDVRSVPPPVPCRPAPDELGTRRREEEQRPLDGADDPVQQVEEGPLRPVEVLDEQDQGSLGRELLEELDPGLLMALARGQGMQISGDVQSEREGKNLPRAESAQDRLSRVALEDSEVLFEHLAERPVGDALPV